VSFVLGKSYFCLGRQDVPPGGWMLLATPPSTIAAGTEPIFLGDTLIEELAIVR
jgi:hypothetical protein